MINGENTYCVYANFFIVLRNESGSRLLKSLLQTLCALFRYIDCSERRRSGGLAVTLGRAILLTEPTWCYQSLVVP